MFLVLYLILLNNVNCLYDKPVEDTRGVREPLKCEVCKNVARELQNRLEETGKIKDVLKIGSNLMDNTAYKTLKYQTSELRYIEMLDGLCEKILEYNVHKERLGSLRYEKGQSETMSTLHGLVDRGVKVELGIPYELWDQPSAEITSMKKQCETLIENYEPLLDDWYFHRNHVPVLDVLCKDASYLSQSERDCLSEKWTGREKVTYDEESAGAAKSTADENTNKSDKRKSKKVVGIERTDENKIPGNPSKTEL